MILELAIANTYCLKFNFSHNTVTFGDLKYYKFKIVDFKINT